MRLPHILVISNYDGAINPIRPEAEIFIGLLKLGFRITIVTSIGGYYPAHLEDAGATLINFKPKSKFDFKAIKLIRNYVTKNDVDIVHAFNSKGILNTCIALWSKKTKIVGYRGYTGNIKWYDPTLYLTYLNPRLDYMVCLAESVRQLFLDNGMPKRKPITINKGHRTEWYDDINGISLADFNIPDGAMICAFVANNRTKMKGLHDLIDSTHHLPADMNLRFLLIGQGMDTPEIKQRIAESTNPERFIFTGFRKDSMNIVKSSDLAISVSLYGEATQKAMIEAMYLSKPVIISNISGNEGMVVDGEGGYIVPTNSPKAIADALLKFYSNREQIPKMGQNAKAHIQEFLSNEKTVKEYARFYKSILS